MLSHKVEKYLKTGDENYLLELKQIISQANVNDLNKIHETTQSVIKNINKENNNRMSRLAILGLSLGAGIGHFIFLLDPCASDEVRNDMLRMRNEQPLQHFFLDALVTTAGSFGGLVLSFIVQNLNSCELPTRVNQLEKLLQMYPANDNNEYKRISTPGLSLN